MFSFTPYRQTLRRLIGSPGFFAVALVTLALGVGANAAVFSVVHGVLLKPLPYQDPDELVGLWHEAPGLGFDLVNQSPATYFIYREQGESFVDVGMWDNGQVSITGLDEPEQVQAMLVTDGTLPLLGIEAARGRIFSPEDDQPDAAKTVLLAHGYWQNRFGGDPSAIGKLLRIDGESHEIIGILPKGLRFLDRSPSVYLPFQFDRSEVRMGNFSYQGLARLRPGVSLEQANAEIARLIPVAVEAFPGGLSLQNLEEARFGPKARPLAEDVIGDVGTALWVLMGTVGLVLLIACANVANLFLVRAESRQIEVAVRRALGADRRALLGHHLAESLTLALLGGVLGLGLASLGLRLLRYLGPSGLPRLQEIAIDSPVVTASLALSLLTGLVLGLVSASRRGGREPASALREGGRGGSTGKGRFQARNALVVCQIALALVLLVGTGLLLRSFDALRRVDPGFRDPGQVQTVRLTLPEADIPEPEQVVVTHEQLFDRIRSIPGVASVGLSTSVTMDGWDSNDALYAEDHPMPEGQLPPIRRFKWISGGYFATMGNPLLAGRELTWQDVRSRAPVAVVTENLATELWQSPSAALGKRVRQDPEGPWREIVGVVGNVHDDGVDQEAVPVVFWPMAMNDFWDEEVMVRRSMAYVIRADRPLGPELMDDVRQAVWSVNPNLPLANVRSLDEILARSMARTSFTMVMLSVASVVALALGFVGIFGVASYAAAQRTREIGVRIALGAQRRHVRRMVLGQAMVLAAIGVSLGLVAAAGLTRAMSALLFGVDALDPLTYGLVAVLLPAVAMAASYLPAWRASRVDPIDALRRE